MKRATPGSRLDEVEHVGVEALGIDLGETMTAPLVDLEGRAPDQRRGLLLVPSLVVMMLMIRFPFALTAWAAAPKTFSSNPPATPRSEGRVLVDQVKAHRDKERSIAPMPACLVRQRPVSIHP